MIFNNISTYFNFLKRIIFASLLILSVFIIFGTLGINDLKAGDTYPFSFYNPGFEPGGRLIITKDVQKKVLTYFIKYNWAGESEVIYNWSGIKRNSVRGSSCGNVFILDAFPINNTLIAVWRENSKIYIGRIDSLNRMTAINELPESNFEIIPDKAKFIKLTADNEVLLQINNKLYDCKYYINNININLIADNVISVSANYSFNSNQSNNKDNIKYAFLVNKEGISGLFTTDADNNEHFILRAGYSDDYSITCIKNKIIFVSSNKIGSGAVVQLVDGLNTKIEEYRFETSSSRIIFDEIDNKIYAFYLKNTPSGYYFVRSPLNKFEGIGPDKTNEIGFSFIESMYLAKVDNLFYCVFRNGIISYDNNCNRQASDFIPVGEYMNDVGSIYRTEDNIVLASQKSSLIVDLKYHSLWFINSFLRNTGKLFVPIILGLLLLVYLQLYRHQKRLLNTVLDLPSSGVVLITDKFGRLTRSNLSGEKFLSITHSVPKGKMFQFYCTEEKSLTVKNVVEKALMTKDSITQKIMFADGLDTKEWIFNALPLNNIAGQFRGLVITGFDITEELSKNKLHNWAQLAHDMQTNLSTIRLNAEQIEADPGSDNQSRKEKILHQVSILIQRIRDIVTVGRSNFVEKQEVSAEDICREVRNEFDSTAFPYVSFVLNTQNIKVECDKPKMIRALRNAVENGIRSMKELKGKIIITNWEDNRYAYFSVKDSGLGMDDETKKKMLTPYFTTSQNKGGSGIGTMIMQHVIELHGGEMTINSEKGKGTEIVFCIPHKSNRRKK